VIRLLIVDAGHTLGETELDRLAALSPLPPHVVKEEKRRFLHCTPEPTAAVLEDLCEALLIDPLQLPSDWTSNFTVYPYANEAVAAMLKYTGATAVVLSNMPCTTGPSRMRALHKQLPSIDTIYTSYELGRRKPDSRLWRHILDKHGALPSETVHIGDQWTADAGPGDR
jgi:FMN phosphatase YigB (HAD superfamily)